MRWSTIVGVVGDVRHSSPEEAPAPQLYHPVKEAEDGYIAVRSTLSPEAMAAGIRSILRSINPNLAVADIQTMGELESAATAQRRFQTSLLTVFAGIALLLALVGLYGLMATPSAAAPAKLASAWRSARKRGDVLFLVLKRAALLLALGLVSGLAASWFATRALGSFLFGVGRHDPVTIASVCALLAICGLVARAHPRAPCCVHRSHGRVAHRMIETRVRRTAYHSPSLIALPAGVLHSRLKGLPGIHS